MRKDLSMWQYAVYASIIILMVCGLTFLFSSCMEEIKEDPDQPLSGEKVSVNFTLNGVIQGDNEVVTRSRSDMNPETVVVPFGNDLCMVATLEIDRSVQTRSATSNLAENTLLRIVAYEDGITYHAHADYKVVGGFLTAFTIPLQVYAGNYKFVAYSYNSTTDLPVHDNDSIKNIDPSIDLLWGCYPKNGTYQVTTSTYEDVPITMTHQFSQVTILATTSELSNVPNINGISNVSLTPATKVNLSIRDSALVAGSNAAQDISFTGLGLNTPTVASEPRIVYMNNAETFQVNIGSLSLYGYNDPFANLTATFNKQLQRGVSYMIKVQFRNSSTIKEDDSPKNLMLYAGAFWKHDQKGERLIRIARPTVNFDTGAPLSTLEQAVADGAWTATVVIGTDWIVLDRKMTDDPNVGWKDGAIEANVHSGNDPGFDGMYPVNSTLTSVNGVLRPPGSSGYVAGDEYIYFRIGLTSNLPDYPTVPARYGMVLLTYKDNKMTSRMWLRQGEGSDYIFGNTRISAYNLGKSSDRNYYDNGGFVSYPTQAGYFYQWNGQSPPTPTPLHPVSPTGLPPGWSGSGSSYSLYGVCPTNYVLPTKNEENAIIQQNSNSFWGYYADGFFDRRQIMNGPGSGTTSPNSAVSILDDYAAYIGNLFYNPATHSTVFFPAAGYRTYSPSGVLTNAGHDGMYTTSSETSFNNWFLNFWPTTYSQSGALMSQFDKRTAYSIRCVRSN